MFCLACTETPCVGYAIGEHQAVGSLGMAGVARVVARSLPGVPSPVFDALEWHTGMGVAFGAMVDVAAARAEYGPRRIRSVAMPQLRHIRQIEPDDAGAAASAPDVRLQRVVPAVSIVIGRRDEPEPATATSRPDVDLGRIWASLRSPAVRNGLAVIALMAAVAIAVGDARIGLGGALFVATIISVRFIDRHVTFSFGAGFVGYRSDMGWPHGVQEDDDFHWDWRPRTVSHATERRS